MSQSFVHLHVHSEYSMQDSTLRIESMIKAAADDKMPAIALTDQANLFAMVKFYRTALRYGIKPLLGAQVRVVGEQITYDVLIMTMNYKGLQRLSWLLTHIHRHPCQGCIAVEQHWFEKQQFDDLLIIGIAQESDFGPLFQQGDEQVIAQRCHFWHQHLADRYVLGVRRIGKSGEQAFNTAAFKASQTYGLPLVAINSVMFLKSADFQAHEARVAIANSQTLADRQDNTHYTDQQYLASSHEMSEKFADYPTLIANTIALSKRLNTQLPLDTLHLPHYPLPPSAKDVDAYFKAQCRQGLIERLAISMAQGYQQCDYQDRLNREIDIIERMGFAGYFLIVSDLIRWAKRQGIPVGPGRGSGAGSLVAYALKITDLDPLKHGLIFERFLNPERVSMPDFDIDFCMDRRDEVIDYVVNRYGRDHVAQIITFGRMSAKAVVRDVGRILGLSYGFVDSIAKLIPLDLGITLTQALKDEPYLAKRYHQEVEVKNCLDLALQLEGLVRNAGKHAGGVVISPKPLTHYTALYGEGGSCQMVTHLDKDDLEAIGLVKFDFLGLRTLTIIQWAVDNIHAISGAPKDFNIHRIALDDAKTFALLKSHATQAVFQLESHGMRDLVKRLSPDNFNEIVALVALFRPGPLQSGMVDDYVDRKHKRKRVEHLHVALKDVLSSTYGVILYQEHVMQIAKVLAGYSLGQADLLRRAMGKKKPEEMAKQRDLFTSGCLQNQVPEGLATSIFDLMEKFAAYAFPKAHSVAYALIAYQTAWLKAHYPQAYMAAVLSSDMDNTDKIKMMVAECRQMGIKVLGPCINASMPYFSINEAGHIRYGLAAIKGVGQGIAKAIITTRSQGLFVDFFECCERLTDHKLNRRVLEALIGANAFGALHPQSWVLMASVEQALRGSQQIAHAKQHGQIDLFDVLGAPQIQSDIDLYAKADQWLLTEKAQVQYQSFGYYFMDHPMKAFQVELKAMGATMPEQLNQHHSGPIRLAGWFVQLRRIKTKNNRVLVVICVEDAWQSIECLIGDVLLETIEIATLKKTVLIMDGSIGFDRFTQGLRMRVDAIQTIDTFRQQRAPDWVFMEPKDPQKDQLYKTILLTLLANANHGTSSVIMRDQSGQESLFIRRKICIDQAIIDAVDKAFIDHEYRYGLRYASKHRQLSKRIDT